MIPDREVGVHERLTIGTFGAFRGLFREATASVESGEVVIRAWTDRREYAVAAKALIKDITEVRITPITYGEQVKAAFFRSLVVGGGMLLAVFIIVAFKSTSATQFGGVNPASFIGASVGFCLLAGLLFSFLPACLKLKRDLLQVLLIIPTNQTLVLIIEEVMEKTALRFFNEHGLKISDATKAT
jgi:hypothetical protein